MKNLRCFILFCTVFIIVCMNFSTGYSAEKKKYSTSPPAKIVKKFRVGYLEGGPYKTYQKTLVAMINGLCELGWIEPVKIPPFKDISDTDKLWNWLSENAKSRYLEFPLDAYYSSAWDKKLREKTKKSLLQRLNQENDIDLMIAMGTLAGQDLANNDHSVPTIVCSSSDPIAAGIVKGEKDSGYDHIHAHLDPTRYARQIRAFHDVIGFKKLGMVFRNTVEGRSIAAIEIVKKIALKRNFDVLECHTLMGKSAETIDRMHTCFRELAPKADAFYIIQQSSINVDTLPQIIETLNNYKIPSFSQGGADLVRHGVLMSIADTSYKDVGRFHAETMARIFNGAKSRDLDQVFEAPVKFAFNKAAAKNIDLKDDTYRLLADVADEVYEKIEVTSSPPLVVKKKWRIGYLEGGLYKNYQNTLLAIVNGLSKIGWIEKITIPPQKDKESTKEIWKYLADNVTSKYIRFVSDAYYSNNWNSDKRAKNKNRILGRLNQKRDIDLMIAMGTWAGQDLSNNDHAVPTVVCSTSDAVRSKIINSVEDSGYDHIHAQVDPTRYERQVRAFHDIIKFHRLGLAFEDTETGRTYSATEDIEKIAGERNFKVIKCRVKEHDVSITEAETGMIKCVRKLAPEIDAFYFSASIGTTSNSLPRMLAVLNDRNIPTFAQSGSDEVRQGVLLSVATPDFSFLGLFHAETMGKIINGAKPRDLNQIHEAPVKIAFNAATAMMIGINPQIYNLLSETAEEVYEKVEKP
ncbi:ABC transporter substrate binding protein [Desulfococcaceae bacterium HSG9]|nr:ABC transporter substrate binding protein [Desulfococcaceae bacterium HSG9]